MARRRTDQLSRQHRRAQLHRLKCRAATADSSTRSSHPVRALEPGAARSQLGLVLEVATHTARADPPRGLLRTCRCRSTASAGPAPGAGRKCHRRAERGWRECQWWDAASRSSGHRSAVRPTGCPAAVHREHDEDIAGVVGVGSEGDPRGPVARPRRHPAVTPMAARTLRRVRPLRSGEQQASPSAESPAWRGRGCGSSLIQFGVLKIRVTIVPGRI